MSYQLNEEWGVYNANNDTDKAMMDLLVDNKNDVCHFFRQFGFSCACIENDLKNLTLYNYKKLIPLLIICLYSKPNIQSCLMHCKQNLN